MMTRWYYVLMLVLPALLISCVTAQDDTSANSDSDNQLPPTLDTSRVRTILPTVPPAEVQGLAQIADESTVGLGRELYNQYCSECHGRNGEGQFPETPLQPDSTGRFGAPPHNENGHTWHHADDLLMRIIREGGSGDPAFYEMPAFGDQLNDEQIEAVLAYIKTMWTEEQRLIQAENTLMKRQQP
jgi:mono/diheme cytochrome c family protein